MQFVKRDVLLDRVFVIFLLTLHVWVHVKRLMLKLSIVFKYNMDTTDKSQTHFYTNFF